MKNLYKLIIIAVSANILSVLLYCYLMILHDESGQSWFIGLFCLPAIWIASAILAAIFSYRKKMSWWTALLVLFCTPIPIGFIHVEFFDSDIYEVSSGTITKNNFSLMSEEWVYKSNNKPAVNKYYRIYGSPDDTSKYKKDSVWTYFNKSGNIIKIEKYNDGKLISTIKKDNTQ